MARAALVWTEGENLRVGELRDGASNSMGRADDAAINIDDKTVSRQQASVRAEGDKFVIDNLSTTNPTRLNGQPIGQASPLVDGDEIGVGNLKIYFTDLAAADTLAGPSCSYCKRENSPTDKDCWYCGTSLVNAPTTIGSKRRATCRLIDQQGRTFDLYRGQAFVLRPFQAPEVFANERLPREFAAAVEESEGKVMLMVPQPVAELTLNGQPGADKTPLKTGDQLRMGDGHYVVILR
jgi:FHA domain